MRKRTVLIFFILSCVMMPSVISAAPSYMSGKYNKVTTFNKITDYFATLGKSENDKKIILHKRKVQRKHYRLNKNR